jgi:hypothetical protein
MRTSDRQVARGLTLFADMQEVNFRALTSAALLQSFPPHVILIREGELPDFLFVLVAGAVEMYTSHAERQTTLQACQLDSADRCSQRPHWTPHFAVRKATACVAVRNDSRKPLARLCNPR